MIYLPLLGKLKRHTFHHEYRKYIYERSPGILEVVCYYSFLIGQTLWWELWFLNWETYNRNNWICGGRSQTVILNHQSESGVTIIMDRRVKTIIRIV